jgi:hypothetical protein
MAPREIAYDLSLHVYSPPFANTSRKRLSGDDTQSFDAERPELKPKAFRKIFILELFRMHPGI